MKLPVSGLVAAAALVLCLSACSSKTDGTAQPSSSGTATTGSGSANPDVPKVPQALDASAYVGDPCKIVPKSALDTLHFTAAGEAHTEAAAETKGGPYCEWIQPGEAMALHVSVLTGNRDNGTGGLAGVYGEKAAGHFKFLEPAPDVEGYPALFADASDRRAKGNCNMYVGIADDLAVGVSSTGYEGEQDSCAAAQQAAAAVLKTLKGA